jgi:cytochrome c553
LLRHAGIVLSIVAIGAALVAGCGGGMKTGPARGAQVFRTCTPCHGAEGGGNTRLRAPAIAGLPEWYIARELEKFRTDVRGAHPDDNEGHRMRPMARTLYHPGDLETVAAYVAALPAHPTAPTYAIGDTAAGSVRYNSVCTVCHGPDARGNEALGAPKLVGQWDWYLMAQLEKFHSGMRGTNAADSLGAQMRAMSLTLEDSTAMHDVVAYIKSLPAN